VESVGRSRRDSGGSGRSGHSAPAGILPAAAVGRKGGRRGGWVSATAAGARNVGLLTLTVFSTIVFAMTFSRTMVCWAGSASTSE